MHRQIYSERCTANKSPLCTGFATARDIDAGGMFRPRGGGFICEHCDLHGVAHDKPERATDYISRCSSLAGMEDLAPGYGIGLSPDLMVKMTEKMRQMGMKVYTHEDKKRAMFATLTARK